MGNRTRLDEEAHMLTAGSAARCPARGVRRWISRAGGAVMVFTPVAGVGVLLAPLAAASPAPDVAQAVASARAGAQCGPLRYNPVVEHAAEIVNRSTYDYLKHTAKSVPIEEPHPTAIMKDLGIGAGKVLSLKDSSEKEADAIKGMLLQGYAAWPDCSYTDFGVSLLHEEQTGYFLVIVVLVGE